MQVAYRAGNGISSIANHPAVICNQIPQPGDSLSLTPRFCEVTAATCTLRDRFNGFSSARLRTPTLCSSAKIFHYRLRPRVDMQLLVDRSHVAAHCVYAYLHPVCNFLVGVAL